MTANKPASRRSLKSDLARVDLHKVRPEEYDELPELTEEMLARATVNKGGRPVSDNPRKLIPCDCQLTSSSDGRLPVQAGKHEWSNG